MMKPKMISHFVIVISFALLFGCATLNVTKTSPDDETSGKDTFLISHSFDADIKTMFEMWIKPDRFAKWLGPAGASMTFINVGLKEGGTSQWAMTTSDGVTKYGKLNYKKIGPPSLLIYTQNFCDKEGNLSKPPFSSTYPDMLLTTVTFEEDGKKKTKVTVKWEVFGEATETERQTFLGMRQIMTVGWNSSFDKLETLLKSKK
ncbi:SRPBCC family protein [Leptospira licerasiae]|uniref:Lipoprotein n=1 Tax=Leptospira licerasiae str. MMD4847 TaxID=1049971 RepID=A0ABP2REX0_9LEPT|nr:SRPBCC domain-containing protein [Leptospira licerasiae]EJZ41429.1 putative lipoprotein [Leptospira licerasiae str. MMD4847]